MTYHLRPNTNYRLILVDADQSGIQVEEVFSCPTGLRRPSAPPKGWRRAESAPAVATVPVDDAVPEQVATDSQASETETRVPASDTAAPVAKEPEAPPVPASSKPDDPARSRRGLLLAGSLLGIVGLCALAYFLLGWPMSFDRLTGAKPSSKVLASNAPDAQKKEEPKVPSNDKPSDTKAKADKPADTDKNAANTATAQKPGSAAGGAVGGALASIDSLEGVRKFLAAEPPADSARALAENLAQKSALRDGRFLALRYAARRGDPAAARALGELYDPAHWSAQRSPFPNPSPQSAADWYRTAAEAGDTEAQFRYAMMLRSGKAKAADPADDGSKWLEMAAKGGHPEAAKAMAAKGGSQ
ncbi:MAG: sel1 repeat family protein [Burkholderiaceae bacterium]|nr:sel1 repeat family protein [Burkholderiaceae bacterium]